MNAKLSHSLYWSPRILSVLFAVFLSLFALDVFHEGRGIWATALALAMHLIPVYVVLIVLALAWRWEWIGATLYTAAGLCYAYWARRHPSWILVISGPLFLNAALFLVNWRLRGSRRRLTE